jgi:hypothetical protein
MFPQVSPTWNCQAGASVCPCRSQNVLSSTAAFVSAGRSIIDGPLRTPARWRGSLRREAAGYGTDLERQRYSAGFDWAVGQAITQPDEFPTIESICGLHERVVGGGQLRTGYIVVGDRQLYPHPGFVPTLLSDLLLLHSSRLRVVGPVQAAAELHLDFVSIHPFPDGNGRCARVLVSAELARAGFRSTLFTGVEQHFLRVPTLYIGTLRAYQTGRICRATCVHFLLRGAAERLTHAIAWRRSGRGTAGLGSVRSADKLGLTERSREGGDTFVHHSAWENYLQALSSQERAEAGEQVGRLEAEQVDDQNASRE